MEPEQPKPEILAYSDLPTRKSRRALVLKVLIVLLMIAAWEFGGMIQRTLEYRYNAWRLPTAIAAVKNWKLPADQPVYVEGTQGIEDARKQFGVSSYVAKDYLGQPAAIYKPATWLEFIRRNAGAGGTPGFWGEGDLFCGQLTTPSGTNCLVHIGWSGGQSIGWEVFSLKPASPPSPGLPRLAYEMSMNIYRDNKPAILKIMAGQKDPLNTSRIIFKGEYNGKPGTIVGELDDSFYLHLSGIGWMGDRTKLFRSDWTLDHRGCELAEGPGTINTFAFSEDRLGIGAPVDLALSPDGKWISIVTPLKLLDVATSLGTSDEPRSVVKVKSWAESIWLRRCQFSLDGQHLVVENNNQLEFWSRDVAGQWKESPRDAATIAQAADKFRKSDGPIITFGADDWCLLTSDVMDQVKKGSLLRPLLGTVRKEQIKIPAQNLERRPRFALSPDLSQLAVCSIDAVSVYDVNSGVQIRTFRSSEFIDYDSIPFWSPDGKTIAIASRSWLYLWQFEPQQVMYRYYIRGVNFMSGAAVCFSADGKTIGVVAGGSATITIIKTGNLP